jgi:hypothetical protein
MRIDSNGRECYTTNDLLMAYRRAHRSNDHTWGSLHSFRKQLKVAPLSICGLYFVFFCISTHGSADLLGCCSCRKSLCLI